MEKKLKQAIALIESAMADIKQSEIIYENAVNNMLRRQLKAAVESIDLCIADSTPLDEVSTKVNSVTASSFLDWYFTDEDDTITIGNRAIDELKDTGTFTISVEQLFDECGYIPQEKCENNDGDNEYDPSEVKLING
jgi:hypothetical protein